MSALDTPNDGLPLASSDRLAERVHATAMPRRKTIVLVQTQAEGAGAQEITRILGHGLTARGYDVHQVFFFRRTAAFDQQSNTYFCALERPSDIRSLYRMLRNLLRHVRALRPDAVLTFQHYGNLLGTIAARLAGSGAVIANRVSARSVEPAWTRVLDFIFGVTGLFDRVVVNSKAVADEYDSHPRGFRDRLVRIDHGFEPKRSDISAADARRALRLPVDVPLIGCVARLHDQKNLGAAIRLLPLHPDWHLALAGQGPERERLEELARSLNVAQRLHFAGELSPERVAWFLKGLDIFVFPTLAETFGLAVVEAAQAGVPVVANDLEVLREVLRTDQGACALFVDASETSLFADAVARLLHDPELRATLISRSGELAARYSVETMTDRYAELIQAMSRDGGPARRALPALPRG
jgi:glycosyltransferase involved in cell wall biosynthesis